MQWLDNLRMWIETKLGIMSYDSLEEAKRFFEREELSKEKQKKLSQKVTSWHAEDSKAKQNPFQDEDDGDL